MIILGIDPGTLKAGYGVIRLEDSRPRFIDCGTIALKKSQPISDRLISLYDQIESLIRLHHPAAVAVETQYILDNPKSALQLSMARGVVLVVARKFGLSIFEYSPSKIKQALTGSGSATKALVQKTVQTIAKMDFPPPPDAADAIGIAICHSAHLKLQGQQELWPNQI
jgi:crossover junction endodeoxyribonuclease RuvC